MPKTRRSITRKDDDASSSSSSGKKRFKTFDKDSVAPWSDANHDVLFIVMMQLRFVDFPSFSGVCKSWRSFALSYRNKFMASKPPMVIRPPMSILANWFNEPTYLKDFEGKSFKTVIPQSVGRKCVGLTCGYVILFGSENCDFLLVNPVTKHELHSPHHPSYVGADNENFRGILVFSPSISGWVFVMLYKKISFYVAGERRWNHVSSTVPIVDLHFFKGKIYVLHKDCSLGELRLNPNLKRSRWTLHETRILKNPPHLLFPRLVSSAENLYMLDGVFRPGDFMELDFDKMEWVSPVKTIEEYQFFYSFIDSFGVIKSESYAGPWTQYKSCGTDRCRLSLRSYDGMWYFPDDCLNVNQLDE